MNNNEFIGKNISIGEQKDTFLTYSQKLCDNMDVKTKQNLRKSFSQVGALSDIEAYNVVFLRNIQEYNTLTHFLNFRSNLDTNQVNFSAITKLHYENSLLLLTDALFYSMILFVTKLVKYNEIDFAKRSLLHAKHVFQLNPKYNSLLLDFETELLDYEFISSGQSVVKSIENILIKK